MSIIPLGDKSNLFLMNSSTLFDSIVLLPCKSTNIDNGSETPIA